MKTAASKTAARTAKAAVPAAKPAAKSAKPAAAKEKPIALAQPGAAEPAALKVVRDGFTMPQSDYDQLKALKAVCLKRGLAVKKSELLRAGVQALTALPAKELDARIRALVPVKAGRKKNKD